MSIEIVTFSILVVSALVFAAANGANPTAFRFALLWSTIFYIFSIRLSEFNGDIKVYAQELATISNSLYYLKEAVYWVGSRNLFKLFQNEIATFIVIDLMTVTGLFFALRLFRAPKYAYFLILVVFPNVFGFQNIYRQLIASTFLLLGVGLIYSGRRSWVVTGLMGALVHNPSALFGPMYLWLVRGYVWIGIAFGLALGGALRIASQFESSSTSGGNFSMIMSAFVIFTVAFLFVKTPPDLKSFRGLFAGIGVIAAISPFMLPASTSERISFYMVVLLFPFLVSWVESRVRPRIAVRSFLVVLYTAPTFLSSARGFILY